MSNGRAKAASGLFDELIVEGPAAPRTDEGRFLAGNSYSPKTQIKKGQRLSPTTEIRPGDHLGLATEFRKGQAAHNKLSVGSVTIRKDPEGKPRAWVKVDEPNIWKPRAIIVWEQANGPVPRGKVIHHADRDTLNDSPGNLEAKSRGAHADEHRAENEAARVKSTRQAIAKVGREDVPVIRRRAAAGETYKQIAEDYPLSHITIGCIVRRDTWRDVP